MKRLSLFLLTWLTTLAMNAVDYQYLTFEMTDGMKISVPAESLTMTFSGTTLNAGEQSFTLVNLVKMYFSTSDETSGISDVSVEIEGAGDIYDLQGRKVTKEQMHRGQVYIVKTNRGTHKLTAK